MPPLLSRTFGDLAKHLPHGLADLLRAHFRQDRCGSGADDADAILPHVCDVVGGEHRFWLWLEPALAKERNRAARAHRAKGLARHVVAFEPDCIRKLVYEVVVQRANLLRSADERSPLTTTSRS